jgi:hypothetical protein
MAKAGKTLRARKTSRNDRWIIPSGSGDGWDIVKEGHRRATGHAQTKAGAISSASSMLRNDGGGELRILNRAGKITDSNTISPRTGRKR